MIHPRFLVFYNTHHLQKCFFLLIGLFKGMSPDKSACINKPMVRLPKKNKVCKNPEWWGGFCYLTHGQEDKVEKKDKGKKRTSRERWNSKYNRWQHSLRGYYLPIELPHHISLLLLRSLPFQPYLPLLSFSSLFLSSFLLHHLPVPHICYVLQKLSFLTLPLFSFPLNSNFLSSSHLPSISPQVPFSNPSQAFSPHWHPIP